MFRRCYFRRTVRLGSKSYYLGVNQLFSFRRPRVITRDRIDDWPTRKVIAICARVLNFQTNPARSYNIIRLTALHSLADALSSRFRKLIRREFDHDRRRPRARSFSVNNTRETRSPGMADGRGLEKFARTCSDARSRFRKSLRTDEHRRT